MKLPPGPARRMLSTPRRSSSTWMPRLRYCAAASQAEWISIISADMPMAL